jgi:hypothetical protein
VPFSLALAAHWPSLTYLLVAGVVVRLTMTQGSDASWGKAVDRKDATDTSE